MLVLLWGLWFFFASIALYEISEPLAVTRAEVLVVNFPMSAQGRVQRGQQALIKLDTNDAAEIEVIPALVTNVQIVPEEARVETTLFSPWMFVGDLHDTADLTGHVEVEVEHLSPAQLVVRAVNDKLKSPSIRFTPRNNLETSSTTSRER